MQKLVRTRDPQRYTRLYLGEWALRDDNRYCTILRLHVCWSSSFSNAMMLSPGRYSVEFYSPHDPYADTRRVTACDGQRLDPPVPVEALGRQRTSCRVDECQGLLEKDIARVLGNRLVCSGLLEIDLKLFDPTACTPVSSTHYVMNRSRVFCNCSLGDNMPKRRLGDPPCMAMVRFDDDTDTVYSPHKHPYSDTQRDRPQKEYYWVIVEHQPRVHQWVADLNASPAAGAWVVDRFTGARIGRSRRLPDATVKTWIDEKIIVRAFTEIKNCVY